MLAELGDGRLVPRENGGEGQAVLPARMRRSENPDAVEREHGLRIERMLDPERAVLIEGRDPVLRRDIGGFRSVGDGLDEIQNRLPRRSVIPRSEHVRGPRRPIPAAGGDDQSRHARQQTSGLEQGVSRYHRGIDAGFHLCLTLVQLPRRIQRPWLALDQSARLRSRHA